MSLTQIKKTAKALFAKIHNVPVHLVTTSVIKKQYPKFRATNKDHWELLILKLLGRDRKANKPKTPYEQLQDVVSDLYDYGVYTGRYDFHMGVCCTFNKDKMLVGTIGYSESRQKFYYSFGRNGSNRYVATINQAVSGLFPNISKEVA